MKTDNELITKGLELCIDVMNAKTREEALVLKGWLEAVTWVGSE